MLVAHGGVFLASKTEGVIRSRAQTATWVAILVWAVLFALGGIWINNIEGYTLLRAVNHNGESNPLLKEVSRLKGVWNHNFNQYPLLYLIPGSAFFGALLTLILQKMKCYSTAFIFSAIMVCGTISTAGAALFPFILPSSLKPSHSLILWDSSSSHATLWMMTLACIIFVPLIVSYTSWVFRVLRGPITDQHINDHSHSLY
jgi:cytochrome bd ubiquinol oxidase subunit II